MPFARGIQLLTSTGATITITDPAGPDTNIEAVGGGGGITALTGDVTASGTGSVAATLQNTANVISVIGNNALPIGPVPTGVAATDTPAVQAWLTANAGSYPNFGTAYLTHPGTFAINATLHCNGNLVMGPSTILQASTGLSGPVLDSGVGTELQDVIWTGGTIDANGKAGTQCLYPRFFQNMYIEIDCINSIVDFVILGDPASASGSYAATLGPNMSIIAPAGAYAAGYSCLWIQNATDNIIHLANCEGAETGIRAPTGDNKFIATHPNGNPGSQPMLQCFADSTDTNAYLGAIADTPSSITHSGATGSASNNTIADTAIKAQHVGLPVTGTNIPAGSYVGTVTPGVSFLLITATNGTSTPTGTVSGISLVGVGWNMYSGFGYPNSSLNGCIAYINSSGLDATMYAVTVGPNTTGQVPIIGLNVIGNSSSHRWLAPFAGLTTSITYMGLQQNFVVNPVTGNSNIGNPETVTVATVTTTATLAYGGNKLTLTSGSNLTLTMPPAVAGAFCWVEIIQPGSGTTTNTVTQATSKWPGGTKPTMSTGASATDRYDYFCPDGSNWFGVITGQAFA